MKDTYTYSDAVTFHGHSCPGLAMGYRISLKAMYELRQMRALDEEIVAIVENDSCSVDAVQFMTGCTFGKGNFIFKDYGKQVFTFFNRVTGHGVRIYARYPDPDPEEREELIKLMNKDVLTEQEREHVQSLKKKRVDIILNASDEDILSVSKVTDAIPPRAAIFESEKCQKCGELVMSTRTVDYKGLKLCISCSEKV